MFSAPETRSAGTVSKELLYKFRDLVYANYGIHYTSLKLFLLRSKLEKIAGHVGNMQDFYYRVSAGESEAVALLLKTVTVGHTFFFREESHFEMLVDDIRKRRLASPTIWCAASSTGEEPYSIAMSLLESGIGSFRVVSSDINATVLSAMDRGIYQIGKFSNTPPAYMRKYFQRHDAGSYRIRKELREYLKIKRLNLHEDIRFAEPFDYIFCRNVMIYFDDAGRRKVVENLVQNLKVGGLLFVGHTEALLDTPPQLKKKGHSVFIRTA